MTKLNSTLYKRLEASSKEANEIGMNKLASAISSILEDQNNNSEENLSYNYKDLEHNVYNQLWSIASEVASYHNSNHINVIKLDNELNDLTASIIESVEKILKANSVGPLEDKLPGEK